MHNSSEVVRRSGPHSYTLHVTKDHSNMSQAGSEQYRVEVSSKNTVLQFATAQIAVVKTETCGYGGLDFTRTAFYKEEPASGQCPVILITKSSEKMMKSPPLLWKPPPCGCVQFRALVFEDKTGYYGDDKNVHNGVLTTTVCVRKRDDRQQYINALCRVRGRYSAAEIVNRGSFKIRHGIRDAAFEKRVLVSAYEARLERVTKCCSETSQSSQRRCFDRTRFHRVDRLCEDGIPDLSFTTLRRRHTRSRERKCCFIMGSHRYACFNHRSGFSANSIEAGILDYSLDETDPLNDLSDIATDKDGDILSMLSHLEFGAKFESDEKQTVSMKDIGSKRVSSEETSSAVSMERTGSRRREMLAPRPESVDVPRGRPATPELLEDEGVASAAQPTRRVSGETPATSARRRSGNASRRRGRRRGRNSGRRRNSGQRRRSGRASRESRRRGRGRRRSGSKERRRRFNSRARARQSRRMESREIAYSLDFEEELTPAEKAEMQRMIELQRLRKTCCGQGESHGIMLARDQEEHFSQLCEAEAATRQQIILDLKSESMAYQCYKSFSQCCKWSYFGALDMGKDDIRGRKRITKHRSYKQRVQAKERSDERGDGLDFGRKYAEREEESEKRYQHMRTPQKETEEDEEEKDGPARHDEMDQGEDNGRLGAVDTKKPEEQQEMQLLRVPSITGRSTASEEIQDFDDRTFGDSREEEEEDEDEDDGETEGDGVGKEGNEEDRDLADPLSMFKAARLRQQRQKPPASGGELPERQRVGVDRSAPEQRRSSSPWRTRKRNRSNPSRERLRSSRGGRNSRARTSRQNRSNLRSSRNMPGRYRSLSGNRSRSSRMQGYRDSRRKNRRQNRRNSMRNSGGTSKRRNVRNSGRFRDDYGDEQRVTERRGHRQKHTRSRTPLDSKEMAQQHREPITGVGLVEGFYKK
ncbi:hypothetical protein ElyMa_004072100 [Elysia marginata]|uniref:Uncharacterized protein n=1 Tax=Elysia marginata TaxID=1093978 RepID=A0AAV4GA52_9GAST|nr:hypothetical protein ElyMa_004072100 [Elysia marginata]